MKWLDVPDSPGLWLRFYNQKFQSWEYVVIGQNGPEYSRIPGVGFDADNSCRWFGPIPPDPEAKTGWCLK